MSENVVQNKNKVEPAIETIAKMEKGKHLQNARESMGWSLDEVSQKLHIEKRFITALECDDHSIFSGSVYVYGCMRAYAKLLKLPVDEFTADLTEQEPLNLDDVSEFKSAGQPVKFSPAVFFYSFLLVLIVCVIWFVSGTDDNEMSDITDVQTSLINAVEITDAMVVDDMGAVKNDIPVITEENMQPIVIDDSNVPNGIEKLDGESELVLEYIEESWTDIKDANGKQLVYRMAKKGSVINLTSVSPFNILLGYSSGVIVKYNGEIFNHSAYARDNVAYFTVGKKITKVDKEKPGETIVKKMPAVLDKQEIIVPPVIKEKDAVTTLPVVNEKITEEVEPVNDVITTDEKIQKKEIMFELFPD